MGWPRVTASHQCAANRDLVYTQQAPILAVGFSSQTFGPNFPHTVRTVEARQDDNNAIAVQLLMQGHWPHVGRLWRIPRCARRGNRRRLRLGLCLSTSYPAASLSRGLERDRAVDETGGEIAVFGRIGSRPFTWTKCTGLYLDPASSPWFVNR